jgi:hypothetical protein
MVFYGWENAEIEGHLVVFSITPLKELSID